MTSAELRRIVGAMTPTTADRPWISLGEEVILDNTRSKGGFYAACASENPEADTAGIATLRNHATALVALLEACEAIGTQASGLNAEYDQIADIRAATRRVHATKAP